MKWILILESVWPKSDEGMIRIKKKENENDDGKRESQKTELKKKFRN